MLDNLMRKPSKCASEEEMKLILGHWNSKGIIVHKPYPKFFELRVSRCLEEYSLEEVLKLIDRYGEVFHSDYWFDYKWSLMAFLQTRVPDKSMLKFSDEGSTWASYCTWKENKNKASVKRIELEVDDDSAYNKVMQEMRIMPYEDYLRTEHWRHFSKEALVWSGYICQLCNNKQKRLHVHHKTYENRGRETFNDIIVLCEDCHKLVHEVIAQ